MSLYIKEAKLKSFYALGMDYAWGHNSVQVFENEMKRLNMDFIGKVFAPTGTKDYSTYITKIRQSGADGVYLVLAGDDNNAFLAQAAQYQLPAKMAMLTGADRTRRPSRRRRRVARPGRSARYAFTIDTPATRSSSSYRRQEHKTVPDTFEGEQWQCMKVFEAGITKAGGIEADKLRPALEDITIESVKGKVDAEVRSPGRPAGLHGEGRQEGRLRSPDPRGHHDAAGRAHHAALQQDDLRRLSSGLTPHAWPRRRRASAIAVQARDPSPGGT